MGYDSSAARKAVNLSLPVDLVTRARACTANLSGTVEALLADFVAREEARRSAEDAKVARTIETLNAYMTAHGTIADDFSPL